MIINICLNCKKEFKTYLSRIKIGWGKYCNIKCKREATDFKKGERGYWQGLKRPNLLNTNARKTMFEKNHIPWNKGIEWLEMQGKNNPAYKNGKWLDKSTGYLIRSNKIKKIYDHRYIMEKILNRSLRTDEHVHHIDFNKINNNIENLILLTASDHAKIHHIIDPEKASNGGHATKGIPRHRKEVVCP